MTSTYVNDLRLNEQGTGDNPGSWGTVTNTNLELIAEAFSYGTETIGDADTSITMANGTTDEVRSFYLKIASSASLSTTRVVTLLPNTVSKIWIIENATSGGQIITIKQGTGATVNIANGQTKVIATDGGGSGGIVYDLLQDLAVPDLFVDDDLTLQSDGAIINFGADSDITLTHAADTSLTLGGAGSTTGLLINNTATDGDPFLSFALSGTQTFTMGIDDGDSDKFKIGTTAIGTNTRLTIDSSGNVGIGTTDPSQLMEISSSSAPKIRINNSSTSLSANTSIGGLEFNTNDASSGGTGIGASIEAKADGNFGSDQQGLFLAFSTRDSGSSETNTERMRIDSSGNVGIGTTSPLSATNFTALTVQNNNFGGIVQVKDDTVDLRLQIQADTSGRVGTHSNHPLRFDVNSTERMRIDSSGNVSIGTTSNLLSGTNRTTLSINNSDSAAIAFGKGGTNEAFIFSDDSSMEISSKSNNMRFSTSDAERMRIDTSGNVGIGTASPSSTLEVSKSDQTNGATLTITNAFSGGSWAVDDVIGTIDFKSDDASSSQLVRGKIQSVTDDVSGTNWSYGTALTFSTAFNNSLSEAMRIDSSGNVGIGVTTQTAKLQIVGENNSSSTPLGKIANSQLHLDHTTHLNAISQIGFGYTGASSVFSSASIGYISTSQASSGKGDLFFATRDSTSDAVPTERMRIGSAGDVSIGTTVSPPVGLTITADENFHGVNLTRLTDSGNPSDDEELGSYAFNSNAEASNTLQTAEAKMVARCSQDHSGSVAGTDLEFYNKPDGTGPGSAPTQRLHLRQDGRVYTTDTISGDPHRFHVNNRVSIAPSGSKTHTITGVSQGYATLKIGYSDGNAQYAHVVVELGGSMFSSSNGYNATVVANDSSSMSVSITKNLASYVVTVNAGSNFAYGSIELSGGAFNVSTGASYAFS